jgi:ABC-type lipoprotein release transport system permease subunit
MPRELRFALRVIRRHPWFSGVIVFGTVIAVISLVGLTACWLPARRAAHLPPLEALRRE